MCAPTPYRKTGISRLFSAFINSYKGLKYAWQNEEAFRQEGYLCAALAAGSFFFNVSAVEHMELLAALLLIMMVEVINSAIEATINRIGPEHHPLSGAAKDLGSLAVLLAFFFAGTIWMGILWE